MEFFSSLLIFKKKKTWKNLNHFVNNSLQNVHHFTPNFY